jgi:hypothetical protein
MGRATKVGTFVLLLGACAGSARALQVVDFTYESIPVGPGIPQAAQVQIVGGPNLVRFPGSSTGFDFRITGSTSHPSLIGMLGRINEPTNAFTIINVAGVFASVTGVGQFEIFDGTKTLSASVAFPDLLRFGTNTLALYTSNVVSNISNVSYTGTDPALLLMTQTLTNVTRVDATFTASLNALVANGANHASGYRGSFFAANVIPEPNAVLGLALGLPVLMRRKRAAV